jgi:hypothetical protein
LQRAQRATAGAPQFAHNSDEAIFILRPLAILGLLLLLFTLTAEESKGECMTRVWRRLRRAVLSCAFAPLRLAVTARGRTAECTA